MHRIFKTEFYSFLKFIKRQCKLDAVLFTGDAKSGNTYADGILKKTNVGSTNSVTEQTFSVDISDIKTACHIGIIMDSAVSGPGYKKGRVFKIWLS